MSKRNRARGFGGAVVAKNETPPKEISEAAAIERMSRESLEALRQTGFKSTQTVGEGQSVRVLNETPAATEEKPTEQSKEAAPATLSLSKEELTAIAKMAAEAAVKPFEEEVNQLKAQLNAAEEKAKKEKAGIEAEKQAALDKLAVFNNLFKLNGNPEPVQEKPAVPNINTHVGSKSDKPEGALAEFMSIAGPRKESNGTKFISTATPAHKAFIKENMKMLIRDLESYGKQNGLFRGESSDMGTLADTNAITTSSNLPGGFLETLSPIIRETHRPTRIFWQFPDTRLDFRKGNGTTIDIHRAALLPDITNPDDRKLSGPGTFVDIVTDSDNAQTGIVKATIEEWGRGKPGTNANPMAFSQFVQAFSMIEIMQIIDENLMVDYEQWEDLVIKRLWSPTSRVVYANGINLVTAATDVANAAAGRCSRDFLQALFEYMRLAKIPTYMDGCYGLALTTKSMTQLKRSLGDDFRFDTVTDLVALSNIFNLAEPGEVGKVTGYQGKIENFHVFESNSFSSGAAGTEGVRSEAITGGNATTRTNFAFGRKTIGRGIAEPFLLVKDEITNFGRRERVTWLSWEGFCQLDVDPAGSTDPVPQQLRVLDVRFTD
jgi:hypothetical protein